MDRGGDCYLAKKLEERTKIEDGDELRNKFRHTKYMHVNSYY